MEYVESAKECIERRLEGREALSWIERLGVYVIDENIYHAEPERCENVIAIRFNRHAFNAYYCYFYTNEKRETKFTVNRLVEGMDIKEIEDMASRLYIAKLLSEGKTFIDVEDETGASSATISRVNRCLKHGKGYQMVLERLGDFDLKESEKSEDS